MSNSELESNNKAKKPLILSTNFIWALTSIVVLAGIALALIYSQSGRLNYAEKNELVTSAENEVQANDTISYDKNKILVDDTDQVLEVLELPDL